MNPIELPEKLTVGVLIDIAAKIETKEDADALLSALVARARQEAPELTEEAAMRLSRANLGYLGGYCSVDVQRRWETLFGAVHPVFGPVGGES